MTGYRTASLSSSMSSLFLSSLPLRVVSTGALRTVFWTLAIPKTSLKASAAYQTMSTRLSPFLPTATMARRGSTSSRVLGVGGERAGGGGVSLLRFPGSHPASELPSLTQTCPSDACCPAPQGSGTGSMYSGSSPARRNVKAVLCQLCLSTLPCFSATAGRTSLHSSSGADPLVWRERESGFFLQKAALE